MYTCAVRPEIASLSAYVPGMSIAEVRERYGLSRVIKMASNENPLGVSPLVRKVLATSQEEAFRYPQGGNPALREALARAHHVSPERIVVGNGSDEIIDMLIRMLAVPGRHSVVCFEPCFSIYPIQAQVCGVEVRRHPLNPDFSFDLDALFALVDDDTRLVFVTTPDNPSGYCPPLADVRRLAQRLGERFPHCLLVVDEAYMDFAGDSPEDEARFSLLASGDIPDNVAIMRTFSKSYGLAGLRLGYGMPIVMLGTKMPSITSTCSISAPAAITASQLRPSSAKSAARIEGESLIIRHLVGLSSARPSDRDKAISIDILPHFSRKSK